MFKGLQQKKIILASASPNRKKQLQQLGLVFDITPANIDEQSIKQSSNHETFESLAIKIALEKAKVVAASSPDAVVIGVDQLCIFNDKIFGKPHTFDKAFEHLTTLQNQTHQLLTGFVFYYQDKVIFEHCEITHMHMRALTPEFIHAYLDTDKPLSACGSYHYESHGKWLFHKIEGEQENIIGLPITILCNALIQCGIVSFI